MWISGSSASGRARISQVFAYDLGMRLLEREHPLDVLEERARRAAAGHGSVVLVAGEAGIGKTVLLRAFVERARAQPLVASPGASRLQLTPLSRSAIAALVDGHGLNPADLHRRTAGNPFFLSQILAQPDAPMPASVRDAVLARTAGLAPAVRRSLELLSCTPEPVGPELMDALSVSTATVGLLAATGLIDRHGRAVAFRHEIARSAILGAAVPGSEPALHAAMIEALEAIGAEPSVLAHHAAAAGDVPRVLRYAPAAAAEASLRGAPGGRRVL